MTTATVRDVPADVLSTGPGARVEPTSVVPFGAAVPLAVAGGVLLDAAFPALGFWPAAIVAPAVLLIAVRGRRPAAAYLLSSLFGLGFFVPLLSWTGTFVGALPWLALAVAEALVLGLVGLLWPACWRLAARRGWTWTFPLTSAAVWVADEALRSRAPFGGFPWGRLAMSQSDSPLAWLVALGGMPLLSGAVVAIAGALALLGAGHRRALGVPAVALVVTLALVSLAAVAGWVGADTARPGDATVSVAAVQGNVPEAGLDFNAERRAVTDNHAAATQDLARAIRDGSRPPVDLVLWPENASDIDPLRNPDAAAVISRATDDVGVPVLVGTVLREPGDNLTNAYLVWDPGTGYRGAAGGRYDKQLPVPFAEYIPYRSFFRTFSDKVDLVTRDFVAGPGPGVLRVGGAVVGPVICFEVADDGVVGDQVRLGADLLAVPTNNATFGYTDESEQQFVISKLRAIEFGRSVVHVSTVGVSGVLGPDGRAPRTTHLFTQDVLVAEVPLRTAMTPSAVVGRWPEVLVTVLVALAALGLGAAAVRARVARPTTSTTTSTTTGTTTGTEA